MAINKNHEFADLDGVKCAIVEKEVSAARVDFLKSLLEFNKYTVVVIPSPAPKVVVKPIPKTEDGAEAVIVPVAPDVPETFTVGVTTLKFNPINAVFGRALHTKLGHIVTLAYWQQRDPVSQDDLPYFEER